MSSFAARWFFFVLCLSLAGRVAAQTPPPEALTVRYHWTRDYTASPPTQVSSDSGSVNSDGLIHIRYLPPSGYTQHGIREVSIREQAEHTRVRTYTSPNPSWGGSACSICGDPTPPNGPAYVYADMSPLFHPAEAHNGPYDITVKVRSARTVWNSQTRTYTPEYKDSEKTITVNMQNLLITGTTPANPQVIEWKPEANQPVTLVCNYSACYRCSATAKLEIFKSDQTLVRTLQKPIFTDGGSVSFEWDGKGEPTQVPNGTQPPTTQPPATQAKGLYLFRFTLSPTSLYWDTDVDKSPNLNIIQTRSDLTDDYNETTEENTTKDACVLMGGTTPAVNASEVHVRVVGLELNPLAGPITLPVTVNTPSTSPPIWNEATFPLKIDEVETHLFNARDNHANSDKGHRTRWALQHNQKPLRPIADCFGSVFSQATQASSTAKNLLKSMRYIAKDWGEQPVDVMLGRLSKDRVFFYVGGGPADAFTDQEEPYKLELYGGVTGANKTVLMGRPSEKVPSAMKYPGNFKFMDTLPSGALLQTKMTVWLACLTAKRGSTAFDTGTVTSQSLVKGDYNTSCSLGFNDLISIAGYPTWTKAFFEKLRIGQSVRLATDAAEQAAAKTGATGFSSAVIEGNQSISIRL